jgi:large subunit ribosomal protein L18
MNRERVKKLKKDRRRKRIRAKIKGSKTHPRLSVFKSNRAMSAQLVDDVSGKTLICAYSREIKKQANKTIISFELGKLLASRALAKKIERVVFDRGGNKYHGRVKALAEGARQAGLKF